MNTPRNRMATERETRVDMIEGEPLRQVLRKIWQGPAVTHAPALCPDCGSADNKIDESYKPDPTPPVIRKRLHTCRCGNRFWSHQDIPPVDR